MGKGKTDMTHYVEMRCLFVKAVLAAYSVLFVWGIAAGTAVADTPVTKIQWALFSFPPYFISAPDTENRSPLGEGTGIEFLNYVMKRMPDVEHKFEITDFGRIIGLMKRGVVVCNPILLKVPERELFIEYSHPIFMELSHHIVVAEKNIDKLRPYQDLDGKVDLERLTLGSGLRTSITRKRAYPEVVKRSLEKASTFNSTHRMLNSQDFSVPIRQLELGRVDYIIAYPFEINWYFRQMHTLSSTKFVYLPIAGTPEYTLGYVGCTKNAEGKKIIQKLDQIISDVGPRPPWFRSHVQYLDMNGRKRFNAVFDRYQPFGPLKK